MADVGKFFSDLRELDVNDIDFNRVGVWPLPGKIFLGVLLAAALITGTYYFFIKDLNFTLASATSKEERLRTDFERKAHEAVNLQAYRDQLVKMEESFGALVGRLPTDTEVPGLLEDIDDKGVESNLIIESISLQDEVTTDVHVELPIDILVRGGYHEFGAFVSGVAGMPRIVTLHDFEIAPGDEGLLSMNMTAKTYRYKSEGN